MELQAVHHRVTAAIELPATPRILFRPDDSTATYSTRAMTLGEDRRFGTVLSFELVDQGSPDALLRAPLSLDPAAQYLMRCDVVEFPPGGVAYLHTHQGPGIRVLLRGRLRVETGGSATEYEPFEAWFEPGPEPVFAAASRSEPTSFVRCMVLPRRLLGQRSIRYVRDEDADKPKPQRYTVLVDEPTELPASA